MTKETLIKSAIRLLINEQVKQGSWGYALEEDSAYEVSWKDVLNWLEQQPSEDCRICKKWNECLCGKEGHENGTSIGYSIGECKDYEPNEDCISRKETIEWLKKVTVTDGITFKTGFEQILYDIEQMPSVTPQQKATGSWVEKQVVDNEEVEIEQWQSARCSKCDKYHTTPYSYYFDDYNYCPNCGAEMGVSDETI